MSLNAHDQHELDGIEVHLAGSDPRLAAMLRMFGRLTSGEDMPIRERVTAGWRRATRRQPASRSPHRAPGADPGSRPARPTRPRWLWVVLLVWLLATVALAISALALSRRADVLTCDQHCVTPACTAPETIALHTMAPPPRFSPDCAARSQG